jgi:hypothetical protein
MIDELAALAPQAGYGEVLLIELCRAQLALADGDIAGGLRIQRETAETLRRQQAPGAPGGLTPWALLGETLALAAFAQHGEGDDGVDFFESLRGRALTVFDADRAFLDFPAAGVVLAGLGLWGLLKGAAPVEDAVRLLVLAERFSYNQFAPTLRWPVLRAHAERVAPGVLPGIAAEYGRRRGPDLLAEARAVLKRVV